MTSDFDRMIEEIQRELLADYSETVIDHAQHPRNMGPMPAADGFARVTGPCGDTMEIWLKVAGDRIKEATFRTDGCGTSVASGSMITELARGKSPAEGARISQQDVLDALGGLPEDSEHCALLASNTLKEAVRDYLRFKNEPWKRAYRREG
jgi:nitrogen fixation NifU-like protein